MKTFIYMLIDPITDQVRYVGKANNPKYRLSAHLCDGHLKSNTHKNNWIKHLKTLGLKPILKIICEVDKLNWEDCEKYWISYFDNLTNGNAGGQGNTVQPKRSGKNYNPTRQKYEIETPSKELIYTYNLAQFAKEYNLDRSSLYKTYTGSKGTYQHKGYILRKVI